MNHRTLQPYASSGLEILKRSVLLVLYEEHVEYPDQPYLTQIQIRERLDIPKGRSGQNHFIRGILEILEVEKSVEPNFSDAGRWQITLKGIEVIER